MKERRKVNHIGVGGGGDGSDCGEAEGKMERELTDCSSPEIFWPDDLQSWNSRVLTFSVVASVI